GVLAGHEHSFEAVADPALRGFVERMLLDETLPTLAPVPGIDPRAYVDESLRRIANTAIRHRCHQIATDGSQKIVQRLVNPLRERLAEDRGLSRLATAVAAWMAYLVLAAPRFGRRWPVEDPYAPRVATIADAVGADASALAGAILAIDGIFDPSLVAS